MEASKLFGLLSDDRRRRVLLLLCEQEPVTVPDDVLTRGETTGAVTDCERSRSRSRHQTLVRLYHADLPKLAAADLIEWDRDAEVVRRGSRFEEAQPLLGVLVDNAACVPQEIV